MLKSTIAALFALTTATAAFADGHAASPIGLVNTDVGQVLASVSNGMTLYTFTQDATNVSNCYGDCANAWPPFLAAADAEAAGGLGIIARDDSETAWKIAHERFPTDRRGELMHQMAMSKSDSQWHHTLSKLAEESAAEGNAYWLGPFQNYNTFCPYLVGSFDEVVQQIVCGIYVALVVRG